jgi:ribonuclease P protein 1
MIQKRTEENQKKIIDGNFQTNYWGHTTFLRRVSKNTEKHIQRTRVLSSIVNNSPSLVFDFRFEHKLKSISIQKSLNRQIAEVININRGSSEPFQLHFCNLDKNGWFYTNYGQILAFDSNMVFETSKSYMDIFPREKLVYLSRDAKSTMDYFDPNKVYIIGAIIDKGPKDFLYASYGQAKKDNIVCQRLPLEKYVKFSGGKNLNLDHMTRILTNLYHNHSDWDKALKDSLPKRKIHSFNSELKEPQDLYQYKKRNY